MSNIRKELCLLSHHATPRAKLQSTKFLWAVDRKTEVAVAWGLSYWLTVTVVTDRHYGYTSTETRNSTASSRRRRWRWRWRFLCDSHSLPILRRDHRHGIIYQTISINCRRFVLHRHLQYYRILSLISIAFALAPDRSHYLFYSMILISIFIYFKATLISAFSFDSAIRIVVLCDLWFCFNVFVFSVIFNVLPNLI